jgi:hypothetical protein
VVNCLTIRLWIAQKNFQQAAVGAKQNCRRDTLPTPPLAHPNQAHSSGPYSYWNRLAADLRAQNSVGKRTGSGDLGAWYPAVATQACEGTTKLHSM